MGHTDKIGGFMGRERRRCKWSCAHELINLKKHKKFIYIFFILLYLYIKF
jgi:hypothetical protein